MKSDLKVKFGSRIKYYRKLRGMTQEQLAEGLDLQVNSLSYVENGKNALSFDKFEKLVSILDIEPYQLFIFDNRDNKNADIAAEIGKIASTLDSRDLELAYSIILQISSSAAKNSG